MPTARLELTVPISSRTNSVSKDSRGVNCLYETVNQQEKWIVKRPGLTTISPALGAGQGQGIFSWNNLLVAVQSNVVNKIVSGVATSMGSMTGTQVPCSFIQTSNDAYLVINNLSHLYYITSGGLTLTSVSSPPTGPYCPGLVYLDNTVYVGIAGGTNGGRIYGSNIEDPTTWNALNYISAVSEPDGLVAIAKQLNYLVAFGQWTTQFFYDAGNTTGSPLNVNSQANLNIGCANGNSVASIEQTLLWVGTSLAEGRSIYLLEGTSPVKVSNRYIDKYLNGDTMTNVRSYCLKISGHSLYVLTLKDSNVTFVFDLDERAWYQWSSQSGGTETYFTPTFFSSQEEYFPGYWFQDESSGLLYSMSPTVYQDSGNGIYFRAVTERKDSGTTKRKFYTRVEPIGDTQSGTLSIRHTDDDYVTWSTYRVVDLSIGRPVLYQLGSSRRRAWEVFSSDNIPIRLQALEMDIHIGEESAGAQG